MIRRGERGFVLLNALILVMGLASVAATLLALAVGSTARLGAVRAGDQAALYLTAGEALLEQVLQLDWENAPDSDHLNEAWATEGYSVPIDRGTLSGRIEDLQGRFNVNWLTDPEDSHVAAAFQRMVQDLGLPVALAGAVRDALRPGGPANPAAYANRALPVRAPGGPIRDPAVLRAVPGLQAAHFARLAPYLSALPADSKLNVNTAPAPVLTALIPAAGPRGVAALIRTREAEPFASPADFLARAGRLLPQGALDGFGAGRVSVTSRWFAATLWAELDGTARGRLIYLQRSAQSGTVSPNLRRALP